MLGSAGATGDVAGKVKGEEMWIHLKGEPKPSAPRLQPKISTYSICLRTWIIQSAPLTGWDTLPLLNDNNKRSHGKSFVLSRFSITFDFWVLLSWPLTPFGHQRYWFGTRICQFDSTIWDVVVETSICRDRDRAVCGFPLLGRHHSQLILLPGATLNLSWSSATPGLGHGWRSPARCCLWLCMRCLKYCEVQCLHALPAAEPLSFFFSGSEAFNKFPFGDQ